jgi:long-subunit acyl-CoA synthetase (AMP-forming)
LKDANPPTPASVAPAQAIEEALRQQTLCAAFQITAAANADRPALRTLGGEEQATWSEYAERARGIATGLHALDIRAGDAVALMLPNCSEFHLLDSAAMHLGAAPFSIYFSNPADQIEPMIRNSQARVAFAAPEYVEKMLEVQRRTGLIEQIVVLGDDAGAGTMTVTELEALPPSPDFDFDATWRAISPDDIAGIVYTSGTTGEPKGVEWSHRALLDNIRGLNRLAPPSPRGRWVSYLPMAHLAERFMSHYCSMVFGYTISTAPDIKQLAQGLVETRPTRFFAVPRIYEKLGEGAKAIAAADDRLREALEIRLRAVAEGESGALDPELAAAADEAGKALAPIREKLGLDATEYRGAAAAPMREDTHHLFTSLGLPVAEIWGMSETALSVSNPPERIKMGTIGKPQPGFEAKLADDGELLIRGPIFSRYRNDPERTREAFDADGWLHTGDVATVDEDGYYKIVDRKKELIINAAGKNIAPAMVEGRVKQQSTLIGHVAAIGDQRSYLTALIVLDDEVLPEFASRHGLSGSLEELAHDQPVHAEVERAVEAANKTLARVEQIKKFTILDCSWLPGSDEVTQTMKLKRRVINTKYAHEIDALYS